MENLLEGFNSRFEQAEVINSKFEDRTIEINQSEKQKEKKMKKNEHSLKDL